MFRMKNIGLSILFLLGIGNSYADEASLVAKNAVKATLIFRSGHTSGLNVPRSSFPINSNPIVSKFGDTVIETITSADSQDPALWVRKKMGDQYKYIFKTVPEAFNLWRPFIIGRKVFFSLSQELNHDQAMVFDIESEEMKKVFKAEDYSFIGTFQEWFAMGDDYYVFSMKGRENKQWMLTQYKDAIDNPKVILNTKDFSLNGHGVNYMYTPYANGGSILNLLRFGKADDWDSKDLTGIHIIDLSKNRNFLLTTDDNSSEHASRIGNWGDDNFVYVSTVDKKECIYALDVKSMDSRKVFCPADQGLSLEYFSPSMNSKNNLVFRAMNAEKKRAVYVYNERKQELLCVVQENDLLNSDLGSLRIYATYSHPGFAGHPFLSSDNKLLVNTSIGNSQETYSKAIYEFDLKDLL